MPKVEVFVVTILDEGVIAEVEVYPSQVAAQRRVHDYLLPLWNDAFPYNHWSDREGDLLHTGSVSAIVESGGIPPFEVLISNRGLELNNA